MALAKKHNKMHKIIREDLVCCASPTPWISSSLPPFSGSTAKQVSWMVLRCLYHYLHCRHLLPAKTHWFECQEESKYHLVNNKMLLRVRIGCMVSLSHYVLMVDDTKISWEMPNRCKRKVFGQHSAIKVFWLPSNIYYLEDASIPVFHSRKKHIVSPRNKAWNDTTHIWIDHVQIWYRSSESVRWAVYTTHVKHLDDLCTLLLPN